MADNSSILLSTTRAEYLFATFPASRYRPHLSVMVTRLTEPVFPARVSASQCPIIWRLSASFGRSCIWLLITIFSLVSTVPLCRPFFPRCLSFLIAPRFPSERLCSCVSNNPAQTAVERISEKGWILITIQAGDDVPPWRWEIVNPRQSRGFLLCGQSPVLPAMP